MSVGAAYLVYNPPVDRLAIQVEYLQRFVSEYVFSVDDRTDDKYVSVIEGLGGIVVPITWDNDFSKARNAAIEAMTTEWVLVLDPDEIPSWRMMDFIHRVTAIRNDAGPKGFVFDTVNYWDGVRGPHEAYHWHTRLFKQKHGRFYRPVHELVAIDGMPENETRGTILGYAPKDAYLIHSKAGEEIAKADALYAQIGEVSK